MIAPNGKTCRGCGEWLPLEEFWIQRTGLQGRYSRCRLCMQEAKRRSSTRRRPAKPESLDREPDDPTPDEIRAACQKLQAGWSTREKLLRRYIVASSKKYLHQDLFKDLDLLCNQAGDPLPPVEPTPIDWRFREP